MGSSRGARTETSPALAWRAVLGSEAIRLPVPTRPAFAWRAVVAIAAIRLAIPLISTLFAPVGYTADELYYLACADHPDWGYVDHPPFSVWLLVAVRGLLGDSLFAVRLVPAVCEALALVVSAAIARELGGGRRAQLLTAIAVGSAPIAWAMGLPYSMNPIEHLLWPLVFWVLARLLNRGDPRLWLVLGLLLGVGLENKLSTLWLGAGIGFGLVASSARHLLSTRWPWVAAAIAGLLLVPHVVWQGMHDWPTLEFIRNNATGREGIDAAVVMASPLAFVASQLAAMGPLCAPLWLYGAFRLLRAPAHDAHRALGWTFVSIFLLMTFSGRSSIYYLVGAYPVVLAAGAVGLEQAARARGRPLATFATIAAAALAVEGALLLPFVIPVVSPDRYLDLARGLRSAIGADARDASLPPVYAWMSGAPELIHAVERVAGSLPPADRRNAAVLATRFGDAGALRHFGAAAGLPPVIGTHNNFWLWGTRGVDGSVMIVIAPEGARALESFASCRVAARASCPHCEPALRDRPVYVCREPIAPIGELWPSLKEFR